MIQRCQLHDIINNYSNRAFSFIALTD